MKPKVNEVTEEEDIYFEDESIIEVDDNEKDPDWRQTPFYKRIRSLLVMQ